MEEKEISFEDVLENLFGDAEISIPNLYRLSDMSAEARLAYDAKWEVASAETRRLISRHLADLSEHAFVVEFAPLFRHMLDDGFSEVRVAALDGLWDTTDTKTITPIIDLMQNDPVYTVKVAAAKALGHFVVMGEWGQIPNRAKERVVDALFAVYHNAATLLPIRCAALESISASDRPEVPGLIEAAYESFESQLQVSSIFAMGNSADERWLPIILDEIGGNDVDLRREAARAAGELSEEGDEMSIKALAEAIFDFDMEVRERAVLALGQIGGVVATRVIRNVLEDPDQEVLFEAAEMALEAIAEFGVDVDGFDLDDDIE